MRRGHPTKEQLQQSFERVLSMVLSGDGVPSSSGLDTETQEALWMIAKAYPAVTDDLLGAARRAFAGQLDGSNTARWRAERDRRFTELEERSQSARAVDSPLESARSDDAGETRRYRNELLAEGNHLKALRERLGTTPEGQDAFDKGGKVLERYLEWLPDVPVARSPFTNQLTTWPIDTVDLDGWFWNWNNPARRGRSTVPSDWLAMGGAMRLSQPLTPMPFDFCMPGPDVPYVVPRLLDLPETRAVIAQVPVGHHTGWTITYFTTRRPHRIPLENTWGTQKYDLYDDAGHWRAWSEHPQDPDEYSFDLRPWLDSGKLLWIAPEDSTITLRSGAADCPYLDLPGQRRMQMINDGAIRLW